MHPAAPSRCLAFLLALPLAGLAANDDLTSSPSGAADHVLLAPVEGVQLAAVRAADDERIAAVLTADPTRLNAILSDQLRYTHANGKVDTKRSFTDALVTHETVYETYAYTQRDFQPVAADIVLMTGRMMIKAKSRTGSLAGEVSLLAVWRLEGSHWRFLAWQSAKLPPPAAK